MKILGKVGTRQASVIRLCCRSCLQQHTDHFHAMQATAHVRDESAQAVLCSQTGQQSATQMLEPRACNSADLPNTEKPRFGKSEQNEVEFGTGFRDNDVI